MRPKHLDLTEFEKLARYLTDAGIPFERMDDEAEYNPLLASFGIEAFIGHHEIFYPSAAEHVSDVIISWNSYGHEDGLLEQMGLLSPCGDSVQGWLNAETVFERWREHWLSERRDGDG